MMTIKIKSINNALLALLTKVEQDSPYLLSQFECMYYLGCRAMESIEKKRWTILDNQFVLLEASKRNNQRIFMLEDVPVSFLSYINNDYILESHVSYSKLNYVFNKCFIYSHVFIGEKQSKLRLFRHSFTKHLLDKGFTDEEIKIKLGEKSMTSAKAYINSIYSKTPYIL